MKYKILLFLCILLITTSITTATENTTNTETQDSLISTQTHTQDTSKCIKDVNKIKTEDNKKTTPAIDIKLDDAEAETYYGGRITYTTNSESDEYVNEGKVTLYVNNTLVATENVGNSIDWMYGVQNNQVLDKYTPGNYQMKIVYTNDATSIESNNATLSIHKGSSYFFINGEIIAENGKIIVPVTALTSGSNTVLEHGNILATYNNKNISSINCNGNEVLNLEIPSQYQQKNVQLTYTDNGYMLEDYTEEVFLDIIVTGTGGIPTTITVNDAKIIKTTHTEDGEEIFDNIALQLNVDVNTADEKVNVGELSAYYNNQKIATSTNTSSILLPVKYNLEEINLTYTGVDDYSNSSYIFTPMADKISTKSYMSYISATKNSVANIYPSITSNIPLVYGKINIYIDDNHVKTIDLEEDDILISLNGTRTTIGSTLNLEGYPEGEYTLTVEVEENNIFTLSEYTTSLTINRVNTYIYANNRNIYQGETGYLYASVYANNRETLNSGQMSFTIDDELIATQHVHNNTANIEYTLPSTLSMGEHTLQIVYEGDDTYNTSTKTVTLTLTRTATTTTLRTWTVQDEKIVLNTQVRAWNKTINTGNIEVIIDGDKVATGKVTDNTANITLPDTINTDTKYNLQLVYTGTDLLNKSTYEQDIFIFNKKNTTTRTYPYLRNNGTITLTGYVYSENYAKVDNGEIIFTINNKEIARAQVNNNKASTTYNMMDYDAGNYTLKATYTGSTLFRESQNNSIITKNPYYHKTSMTLHNRTLTGKIGKSTPINATLKSYTRNITEDIQATITLNATWGTIVYTQDVTFHNGELNTLLNIPQDFELFKFNGQEITRYTLTITTKQSKNFKETSQTGTITIGEKTRIYQKSIWAYKMANITFNTTLQDTNRKQLITNTTAHIDIYSPQDTNKALVSFDTKIINGKLVYVYQVPNTLTNNTYIVNITAHSNNDYAGSYRTVNMTLNNRRTYISAAHIKGYLGNSMILNGTVMDSITRSKVITNGEVDILVDNKKIKTIKTTRGTFKYTITNNYTAGTHNITYKYKGDNYYANTTRTLNLTSNKNTIRITLPNIKAKIGDTINIKANITDNKGKLVKDTLHANIQINNKTIANNITVTNGILSYTYNLPTDTTSYNKITVTIQENNKYKTRNATTTLKINKDYQFIYIPETTITTNKGSKISISGNITDKNRNLLSGTKLNIKIGGVDLANITSKDGKFNYEYTVTQNKGTYDITIKALESNGYLYNAKHMSLKVNS